MTETITIKQLENLEKNIERDLVILENKQMFVKGELQRRLNMNLGRCDHKVVKKGGGFLWITDTEYHYYELWYQCLSCGKIFLESYISTKEAENLEKNVVKIVYKPLDNNHSTSSDRDVVEDDVEKVLTLLSEQLTRLQKGIDNPHAIFKNLGEHHYAVEFKV